MGVKFAPSPYLAALGKKYEGLKASSDALKGKALAESRALTDAESASVQQIDAEAKVLYDQYAALHEAEERDAKIAAMRSALNLGGEDGDEDEDGDGLPGRQVEPATRGKGGAKTSPRDPGHYRSAKDGGRHSFFADLVKAREDGGEAVTRLQEHGAFMRAEMRIIDTAGEGSGVIPPKWLLDEWADIPRQGRALADAVRNIDLGNDPRPITMPKQTGSSDAAVAEQSSEGDPVDDTDGWDSDVDTVTPKPTAGAQIVTRQMLDMSTPAVDELIFGDLIGAYDDKVEAKVCTAILAVGTALAATDGIDVTDPTHYDNFVIPAAMAVKTARKRPPNIYTMSSTRWGNVLNLRDSTGRPLVPDPQAGPMNVAGVGSVQVAGRYHGLGVVDTSGFTDDDFIAAVHLASVLLFEGGMLRFRYEQPSGPEKVRLGVWAYTAVKVRYGTAPVKRVEISGESS